MSVQNNKLMNLADGKALYTDIRQRLNNKEDKPDVIFIFNLARGQDGLYKATSESTPNDVVQAHLVDKKIKTIVNVNEMISTDGQLIVMPLGIETGNYAAVVSASVSEMFPVNFMIFGYSTENEWTVSTSVSMVGEMNGEFPEFSALNGRLANLADPVNLLDATNKQYVDVGLLKKADLDVIASDYADLEYPVAKNEFCVHNGKFYFAKEDIQAKENWTEAHWTEIDVGKAISDVGSTAIVAATMSQAALSALNKKEDKPDLVVNFTVTMDFQTGVATLVVTSDKTIEEIGQVYDAGKTISAFTILQDTTTYPTEIHIIKPSTGTYIVIAMARVFLYGFCDLIIGNTPGSTGWQGSALWQISGRYGEDYDANGMKITSLKTPTNPTDAANKQYVDTEASKKIDISQKGAASGVAELDQAGKVPSSQLPSYVDDVQTYETHSAFPQTGEDGIIYVAKDTNITYRWGGEAYVPIASDLALGETALTAYRGDRGKIAYDHAMAKGSAFASGLYKIATNSEGHVTGATPVVKKDITDLGIPAEAPNEVTVGPTEPQDETKLWVDTDETGESYSVPTMAEFNALDAAKAPKANPVFTGSISMGRKAETTVGTNSIAIGSKAEATGNRTVSIGFKTTASNTGAIAIGNYTVSAGYASVAEGSGTIANGSYTHAAGSFNVADAIYPMWDSTISYAIGDRVTSAGSRGICFECIEATNPGDNPDYGDGRSKWKEFAFDSNAALMIGNGTNEQARSNAMKVDFDGNEYLAGDIYVGCNNDSTGGHKLISTANVATIAEMQAIIDEYDAEVGT